MSGSVERSERDGAIVLSVNNPPVNALSGAVRRALAEQIAAIGADARVIVIAGHGRAFVAGADIREFNLPPEPPFLPDLMDRVEASPVPVVAAIAGAALGGGLELALACHYRIAHPAAKLGLPEVTLGLVPGAGGTQRLPRLIAPVEAARLASSGKPVGAERALDLGLVDAVTGPEEDVVEAALAWAARHVAGDPEERRLSRRPPPGDAQARADVAAMRGDIVKGARGVEAPARALDLIAIAMSTPFAEGLAKERETFLELRESPQAKALRHIFFAERAAAKPPPDMAHATARPVRSVGVIGAGLMGTGIAMSLADNGVPVRLTDSAPEAAERGLQRIRDAYQASVARGRLGAAEAEARIALVASVPSLEAMAGCDLVIEAALESMEVKRAIFAQLDGAMKPDAVLATNTSYLDVDQIAAATNRPQDVLGLHFFSPANVMRLVEVVRAERTSAEAVATALALAKQLQKTPVVARVCVGFIGNRMLKAYGREAGFLLLEGATPEQVDKALTRFGMAMGPFAVADLAGLDIGYRARKEMPPGSFDPRAVRVHDRLVEAGHLGQKSGAGYYVYADKQKPSPNPAAMEIIAQARAELEAGAPRAIDDSEIVDRCMFALANEGAAILEEGVAARSGDVDVVYVNGYGFPRWRGGPMFHAQQLGLSRVVERIGGFAAGRFGAAWRVSGLLADRAQTGRGFDER